MMQKFLVAKFCSFKKPVLNYPLVMTTLGTVGKYQLLINSSAAKKNIGGGAKMTSRHVA